MAWPLYEIIILEVLARLPPSEALPGRTTRRGFLFDRGAMVF
jgi:hypothetical protein